MKELQERLEEIRELEDVGVKRFRLYQLLEDIMEEAEVDSLQELQDFNGYLYKAAQDFLTSSSTYEKENRIEDLINHASKKITDREE
ncbi:MAG: hypothetical protein ABEJ95_07735 [Candidatus Nanohalobium sp.]